MDRVERVELAVLQDEFVEASKAYASYLCDAQGGREVVCFKTLTALRHLFMLAYVMLESAGEQS